GAGQQHVGLVDDPGQPTGRHAELGAAARGERAAAITVGGNSLAHRGRVPDEQELHAGDSLGVGGLVPRLASAALELGPFVEERRARLLAALALPLGEISLDITPALGPVDDLV